MKNTVKITLIREYDKLCVLEQLLNRDRELEQIVSQYIDLCINNKPKMDCFDKIKNKINNTIILAKIIQLCQSIAFDKPIKISINENTYHCNFVKHLDDPYPPLFI